MHRFLSIGILFGWLLYSQSTTTRTATTTQSTSVPSKEALQARLAAHASMSGLSVGGASLPDRLKASTTGTIVDVIKPTVSSDSRRRPTTLDEWLTAKKCTSDLIVDGVITGGQTGLSSDQTAVFQEFDVQVKGTPLWVRTGHQPRLPLVIVKPGGTLSLNGGLVTTIWDIYSDLHLGREYILFLRAPTTATDAYVLDEAQRRPGAIAINPTQTALSITMPRPNPTLSNLLAGQTVNAIVKSVAWASSAVDQSWCTPGGGSR